MYGEMIRSMRNDLRQGRYQDVLNVFQDVFNSADASLEIAYVSMTIACQALEAAGQEQQATAVFHKAMKIISQRAELLESGEWARLRTADRENEGQAWSDSSGDEWCESPSRLDGVSQYEPTNRISQYEPTSRISQYEPTNTGQQHTQKRGRRAGAWGNVSPEVARLANMLMAGSVLCCCLQLGFRLWANRSTRADPGSAHRRLGSGAVSTVLEVA